MLIPCEEHIRFLTEALSDAGVPETTTTFFLVGGRPQGEESEVVYIPPPPVGRNNYPLLAWVGEARLHDTNGLHRFAAYQEVDEAPRGALHGTTA
jgi:hypothetical protein